MKCINSNPSVESAFGCAPTVHRSRSEGGRSVAHMPDRCEAFNRDRKCLVLKIGPLNPGGPVPLIVVNPGT